MAQEQRPSAASPRKLKEAHRTFTLISHDDDTQSISDSSAKCLLTLDTTCFPSEIKLVSDENLRLSPGTRSVLDTIGFPSTYDANHPF